MVITELPHIAVNSVCVNGTVHHVCSMIEWELEILLLCFGTSNTCVFVMWFMYIIVLVDDHLA